jgi:hypothetical protein
MMQFAEQGGMPIPDLKEKLEQQDHNLPDGVVQQVLEQNDTNQNQRVDYNEFREMVLTQRNAISDSIRAKIAHNWMRIVAGPSQIEADRYRPHQSLHSHLYIVLYVYCTRIEQQKENICHSWYV